MNLGIPRWPWHRLWTVRRLLTASLAAVAIFLFWTHVAERGERVLARDNAPNGTTIAQREGHTVFGPTVGFADQHRLNEHYAKHGAEFGRITKQEYLHQAQLLRDTAAGGPVLEAKRADGVTTRFDRGTGAFIAYNADGTIRTFFKPNDGERYFRRQSERSGPERGE